MSSPFLKVKSTDVVHYRSTFCLQPENEELIRQQDMFLETWNMFDKTVFLELNMLNWVQ